MGKNKEKKEKKNKEKRKELLPFLLWYITI